MSFTNTDCSIITQVAFKEAARFYDGSEASVPAFIDALSILSDALFAQIDANVETHSGQQAVAQAQQSVSASLTAELGATEMGNAATVEVITTKEGGQQGPLPEWFITAAANKGVTRVYDNRARLSVNPKLPWFKSPKDQGEVPFWPPRN